MNIKRKLQVLVGGVSCAFIIVVGINYYSTMSIRASVGALTSQSTPAQVKTIELQQNVEKISAEFMRMSVAAEEKEVLEISASIERTLRKVGELAHELETLGVTGAAENMSELSNLKELVSRAVSQKIADTSSLRKESENMSSNLKKVEAVIAEVTKEVGRVNSKANADLSESRMVSSRNNASIKKILTLQARLKDLELGINEMEGVKNRFKLTPFADRFKAIADSVTGMPAESGDPALIGEIKTGVAVAYRQMNAESGLIDLKKKSLANPAVESQYADSKKSMLYSVGALSAKTFEVIDTLEGEMARSSKTMNAAVVFQEAAAAITRLVAEINLGGKQLSEYSKLVMLSTGEEETHSYLSLAQRDSGHLQKRIQEGREILPVIRQDALLKKMDEMSAAIRSSRTAIERIASAKLSSLKSDEEMRRIVETVKAASAQTSRKGEESVKSISGRQREMVASVNRQIAFSTTLSVAVALAMLTVVAFSGFSIARRITGSIQTIMHAVQTIAGGDLTAKIGITGKDEIGMIAGGLELIQEKLSGSLRQIGGESDRIASASEQLSATTGQLERRSEAQAVQAQALAASSDEMAATVTDVAKNASSAADFAAEVKKMANKGGMVVEEAVTGIRDAAAPVKEVAKTMSDLSLSSERIGEVVNVIKDIADQTNLLALNAAIEAARAGEQGRGFAVVADEVRKLAEKTTAATSEIGTMISKIQAEVGVATRSMDRGLEAVEHGVGLAENAGEELREIVSGVERIAEMLSHIAAASNEQSVTIDHMSGDINHVSRASVEFKSATRQIAQASSDLSKVAGNLQGIVKQFTV
ncbi:MAG: methyl-accepting chemotaxis protein [Alphaproteobacteria bacterium]|uniref:Methyl-accepting chemotaxis protein n=1 Tax=Candidatus Nitrobium versatile TaxID=2884831 RepID=A0A953J6S2_9BACT|nr:methyl-accepting chemotaxis protein [Candidatus Nitrobium versatile]